MKVALEKFGGVHILIANAGILRDKSFAAMTEQEWDLVLAIHLRFVPFIIIGHPVEYHIRCRGTYKVSSDLRGLLASVDMLNCW